MEQNFKAQEPILLRKGIPGGRQNRDKGWGMYLHGQLQSGPFREMGSQLPGKAAVPRPHSQFPTAWVLFPQAWLLQQEGWKAASSPSVLRPLGAGRGWGVRIGRGPGGCQKPFLRASSFRLRADEVGLIMTNLEKANQVRGWCWALLLPTVGVLGRARRKELNLVNTY